MAKKTERKYEIPCKSMPNLFTGPDGESESSLNPYALEFIPSYLKSGVKDNEKHCNQSKMKTESTSTTTLVKREREIVGDASYLNAQTQLFELLHQLGDKYMPLKAIKMSLAPDGQGVNVQFKAEQGGGPFKQMLDEGLCQDAALDLKLDDSTLMPRKLPNVLAANFMVRMGDVLQNKMEWNEQSDSNQQIQRNSIMSTHSSSVSTDLHKSHHLTYSVACKETKKVIKKDHENGVRIQQSSMPRPSLHSKIPGWNGLTRTDNRHKSQESQHENKAIKGALTPRQSIGQVIKKGLTGPQKFIPRGTYTSQIRQSTVQKRLKSVNK